MLFTAATALFSKSRISNACLIATSYFIGIWATGIGMQCGDTCWLMRLGRLIFEQHQLPVTEPFSYTMTLAHNAGMTTPPLIMYQWLSEVLLYLAYLAGGLQGASMLTVVILTLAFVVIPERMIPSSVRPSIQLLLTAMIVIGCLAASFHFYVRPEIFSYLIIGCLMLLLQPNRIGVTTKPSRKLVVVLTIMFALWANLHTGFALGLLYLAGWIGALALNRLIERRSGFKSTSPDSLRQWFLLLLACTGATLLNPYGLGLWQYLPTLFFSPLNNYIGELQSVNLSMQFAPFYLLVVCSTISVCRYLWLICRKQAKPSVSGVFTCATIAIAIVSALNHKRMIDFAVLFLIYETGILLSLIASHKPECKRITRAASAFAGKQKSQFWMVLVCTVAVAGSLYCAKSLTTLSLPHTCSDFEIPYNAVEYLKNNCPHGRMFADTQFADTLIWNLAQPPQVFIDTRFDMYGEQILSDYRTIRDCQPGWENLLDRYQISWVFVPPQKAIATQLLSDPHWKLAYSDRSSVVFTRPSNEIVLRTQPNWH